MYNFLKVLISFTFLLNTLSPVSAHGGGAGGEENNCWVYLKEYTLMVSAYQPSASTEETYCSTLPAFAESIIVFDIVDHPLRQIPLSVQISQRQNEQSINDKDEHHHIGKTVTAIPFTPQESGTMRLTFTPEEGSQYAAVLTALDTEGYPQSVEFPLVFGESPKGFTLVEKTLIAFLISLVIIPGYLAFRPGKTSKTKEHYPAV